MKAFGLALLMVVVSWSALGQEHIFLSDSGCKTETLFAVIDDARIYASCSANGAERVISVSVNNMAPADLGSLQEISIGFCGDSIIAASAQSGWVTEIHQKDDGSVTWSVPDDEVERLGIPSRARMGGFVVRLKRGWRKSQWISARWAKVAASPE